MLCALLFCLRSVRVSQLLTEISSLQGLATGVKNSSGPFSQFITFDHVYIHRSWGEAIDPLLAEYVTSRPAAARLVNS